MKCPRCHHGTWYNSKKDRFECLDSNCGNQFSGTGEIFHFENQFDLINRLRRLIKSRGSIIADRTRGIKSKKYQG